MNGSDVIAKIAGIESTAKITSVMPIMATTSSIGVAYLTPFFRVKKRSPSNSAAIFKWVRKNFTIRF